LVFWFFIGRSVAADALKVAMLPTLNAMSVMGLISIPGMVIIIFSPIFFFFLFF